jgi:nitroreductase
MVILMANLNEALRNILSRRSVRKYTSKLVEDDKIIEVLKAAMYAPSAVNKRPWEFIVIRDRKLLDKIPKFAPNASMVKEANVAVVVCANLNKERAKGFWIIDCSAATQNLLLAANALGLGSVWTAIYGDPKRVESIGKLLRLPDHIFPFALVPIGYPAQELRDVNRFDENSIHYDKW